MDHIYLQIYDPFVLGLVRLLKVYNIWEVSDWKRVKTFIRFKAAINFNQMTSSERLYMYKTNHLPYTQWFYPPNWESTCTFEIWKIAHAQGMSPSVEDARGGESTRGGWVPLLLGGMGASPRKFLKFRMQESASETIFQWKKTVTILLWNDHFEVISTHFSFTKNLCGFMWSTLCWAPTQHEKNPGINSLDIITVRVLIICVAFSTCSVVVVGGGGETIGVNGVPTLLADSTWIGTIWLLIEGHKNPVIFLLLFASDLSILLVIY